MRKKSLPPHTHSHAHSHTHSHATDASTHTVSPLAHVHTRSPQVLCDAPIRPDLDDATVFSIAEYREGIQREAEKLSYSVTPTPRHSTHKYSHTNTHIHTNTHMHESPTPTLVCVVSQVEYEQAGEGLLRASRFTQRRDAEPQVSTLVCGAWRGVWRESFFLSSLLCV